MKTGIIGEILFQWGRLVMDAGWELAYLEDCLLWQIFFLFAWLDASFPLG